MDCPLSRYPLLLDHKRFRKFKVCGHCLQWTKLKVSFNFISRLFTILFSVIRMLIEIKFDDLLKLIENNEVIVMDVRFHSELHETGIIPKSYSIPCKLI